MTVRLITTSGILRRVAADQDEAETAGRQRHPSRKSSSHFLGAGLGKRQCQQENNADRRPWRPVAGRAGQGFVAHCSRRMNVPQKMHIFKKRVGRDDPFGAPCGAQHSRIIPYADAHAARQEGNFRLTRSISWSSLAISTVVENPSVMLS